jgi:hypothetical protein
MRNHRANKLTNLVAIVLASLPADSSLQELLPTLATLGRPSRDSHRTVAVRTERREERGDEMKARERKRLNAGARLAAIITWLIAIGLVAARVAAATPPAQATGSGTITGVAITVERIADGNRFLEVAANGTLTGTFTGGVTYHLEEVVHEDGSVNFHGFGTFTGTSPCGTGRTAFEDNGSGPATFIVTAHLATVDQAESTANVHSVIDVAQVGPTVTYSGTFSCG